MTTTTKISVTQIAVLGGATNDGLKLGFVKSGAKAAQNDKWDIMNAKSIEWGVVSNDAAGTADAITISGKEITLTGGTTGAASGFLLYR